MNEHRSNQNKNEDRSDEDRGDYSRLFDQLDREHELRTRIIDYLRYFVGRENPTSVRVYTLLLLVLIFGILIVFSILILDIMLFLFRERAFSGDKYIAVIFILMFSAFLPGMYLIFQIHNIEEVSKLNSNFKKVRKAKQEKKEYF